MLKDITIGQYFPGNSFVHKLDARFKILITALFIVMIFTADNFAGLFYLCCSLLLHSQLQSSHSNLL